MIILRTQIALFALCAVIGGACKESTTAPPTAATAPKPDSRLAKEEYPAIAVTTTTLSMRQKPSTDAPRFKCTLFGCDGECEAKKSNTTSLPKGMSVTVLARGEKRAQVKDWNNYWYKIRAADANDSMSQVCEDDDGKRVAWVFGEFLKYLPKI